MTKFDEMIKFANSFPAWIFNLLVVGVVFLQLIVFAKLSMKYKKEFDVSSSEIKRAFRSGLITTVGPALSIFIVGLGLISQIGAPLILARESVVGNAMYETAAAEFGANALGTNLGASDYGLIAYTCSVWVMNLGGCCMLILPLLFVKPLSVVHQKVNKKGSIGKIIGLSASLASFAYFSAEYAMKNSKNLVAIVVAFTTMLLVNLLEKKLRKPWIKEWSLAASIITAIVFASVTP